MDKDTKALLEAAEEFLDRIENMTPKEFQFCFPYGNDLSERIRLRWMIDIFKAKSE